MSIKLYLFYLICLITISINVVVAVDTSFSTTKSPATCANLVDQTEVWATPENVIANNAQYAEITAGLNTGAIGSKLICYSFGFGTNVGTHATIDGIQVEYEQKASLAGKLEPSSELLYTGGNPKGNDVQDAVLWGTTDTVVNRGGVADLWGTTWTPADISSDLFGFALGVTRSVSGGSKPIPYVDYMTITLSYTVTTNVVSVQPSFAQELNTIIFNVQKITNTGQIQCKFDSSVVAGSYISEEQLSCQAPVNPIHGSNNTVVVEVSIDGGSTWTNNSVTFTYIGCRTLSGCSNCLISSCEWCAQSNSCGISTTCGTSPAPTDFCPRITTISPTSGSISGGDIITIDGDYFWNDMQCNFGAEAPVAATFVNSTRVTCPTPSVGSAGNYELILTTVSGSDLVTINPTVISFDYYDCSNYASSCGQCLDTSRPSCSWCLNDNSCVDGLPSCAAGAGTLTSAECPTLYSVNPDITSPGSPIGVTITGNLFHDGAASMKCVFDGAPVAASFVNSTSITCTAPVHVAGEIPVSVTHVTKDYVNNSLTFTYSDCADITDCNICVNSIPTCGWCYENQTCSESLACTSGSDYWDGTTCPSFDSVTPNLDVQTGNSSLDVVGNNFVASISSNYECRWGDYGISPIGSVNATYVNSTLLTCVSPDIGNDFGTHNLYVGIQASTTPYSQNSLPFTYYNCPDFDNCTSCELLADSACSWCGSSDSCTLSHLCPSYFASDTCPVASQVSPTDTPIDKSVTLTITGTSFITSDPNYQCYFSNSGEYTPATVVSPTSLSCNTPATSLLEQYEPPFLEKVFIYHNSRVHDTESLSFLFFVPPPPVKNFTPKDDSVETGIGVGLGVLVVAGMVGFGYYKRKLENIIPKLSVDIPDPKTTIVSPFKNPEFIMTDSEFDFFEGFFKLLTRSLPWDAYTQSMNPVSRVSTEISRDEIVLNATGETPGSLLEDDTEGEKPIVDFSNIEIEPPAVFPLVSSLFLATNKSFSTTIAPAIAIHLAANRCIFEVLRAEVVRELDTTPATDTREAKGTLFRANSPSTKLWTPIGKLLMFPWLFQALVPTIFSVFEACPPDPEDPGSAADDVAMKPVSKAGGAKVGLKSGAGAIEIDPNRGAGNALDSTQAELQLQMYSQQILSTVFRTPLAIHPDIRRFLAYFAAIVRVYFPGNQNHAIGGLIFLRLLCPLLTAPDRYGMTPDGQELSQAGRRTLILVAKVLQTLVNGVLFGRKEKFMVPLNPFIKTNRPFLEEFYEKIKTPVSSEVPEYIDFQDDNFSSPWEFDKNTLKNAAATIVNTALTSKDSIKKNLKEMFPSPIVHSPLLLDFENRLSPFPATLPKAPKTSSK